MRRKTVAITHLPWSLIVIAIIVESITVSLVSQWFLTKDDTLIYKSPPVAFLAGSLGLYIALVLLETTLQQYDIKIIKYKWILAQWGGAFLALCGYMQNIILAAFPITLLTTAFRGFICVFIPIVVLLTLFNFLARITNRLAIQTMRTNNETFIITRISIMYISLTGGVFEFFALPIIEFYPHIPLPTLFGGFLCGASAGLVGGCAALITFNSLSYYNQEATTITVIYI